MAPELIPLTWNWNFVLIGCFGHLCTLLLKYRNLYAREGTSCFKNGLFVFDLLGIPTAGIFVYVLQVVNLWQAFIFGATWITVFSEAVNPNKKRGKK